MPCRANIGAQECLLCDSVRCPCWSVGVSEWVIEIRSEEIERLSHTFITTLLTLYPAVQQDRSNDILYSLFNILVIWSLKKTVIWRLQKKNIWRWVSLVAAASGCCSSLISWCLWVSSIYLFHSGVMWAISRSCPVLALVWEYGFLWTSHPL